MNFSSIIGLFLAVVVFLGAALTSTKNWMVFLDYHAALIVIGGTLAAALLSFSATNMLALMKVFVVRVIKGSLSQYDVVINEIVDLSRGYRENSNYLAEQQENIQTPFLREAVQLQVEGGMSPAELDLILAKRAQTHFKRYGEDSNMFATLSKFPPAFGLLGAVIGMVSLMQGLGGKDAIKTVGPAMAVALVATLYGIAIANFIFVPLGENLAKFNRADQNVRKMVIDGIQMIRLKKHPILVEENLKSYLLPSEREALQKMHANDEAA